MAECPHTTQSHRQKVLVEKLSVKCKWFISLNLSLFSHLCPQGFTTTCVSSYRKRKLFTLCLLYNHFSLSLSLVCSLQKFFRMESFWVLLMNKLDVFQPWGWFWKVFRRCLSVYLAENEWDEVITKCWDCWPRLTDPRVFCPKDILWKNRFILIG